MNTLDIDTERFLFVANGGFDATCVRMRLAAGAIKRGKQYKLFLEEPELFRMLLIQEVVNIEEEKQP